MQKVADESKVEKIFTLLGKIDDDKDGQLKVDDVLKVNIYYMFTLAFNLLTEIFLFCVIDY